MKQECYIHTAGIQVFKPLYQLVNDVIGPELAIDTEAFWTKLAEILTTLIPENQALLQHRVTLQNQIDEWHENHDLSDRGAYKQFLTDSGYLLPEVDDFSIETTGVDPEIARTAGPQLVVPVNNARFALNAANARWGSLYDAFYGTDTITQEGGLATGSEFNPARGRVVVNKACHFLDMAIPLVTGSHSDVIEYQLIEASDGGSAKQLNIALTDGDTTTLINKDAFVGYQLGKNIKTILLKNNGLHIELQIDHHDQVGHLSIAGVKEILLESAITTVQDCEDSVAAVDAEDKLGVYQNWLGLMRGDLTFTFSKKDSEITRTLNENRHYLTPDGSQLILPGRSLMLIRNVGLLMTTDCVLTGDGQETPEGIIDCMMTSMIALYDILDKSTHTNSQSKSIYIVKPKMHGPDEVAFTVKLFSLVEQALGLATNTLKLGIMDEERRTTINLKACIREAKQRIIFINTGFLDRVGDEIHSSMMAGPFLSKYDIKQAPWLNAYEDRNVDTGLACGFSSRAQIGKGMWAKPDLMKQMLVEKISHPQVGGNCAWVPSPTAATLHATHYHQVNVFQVHQSLMNRTKASLDDILNIPLLQSTEAVSDKINQELRNNAQGILGYVVRWIQQGIGCSKVPNINNIGLMEDRATLRISSQHMANWLLHGLCSREEIIATFKRMAVIVDKQNKNDPHYIPMSPAYSGIAFKAALDLVLKGRKQPNGYTEPILHAARRDYKARMKH